MITVTFNFDPDTKKVSGLQVVDADAAEAKPKTKKPTKKEGSTKAILNGNSLQLNQDILDLLGVAVGDRLCVRFSPGPVLVRPDIANERNGGNLITKSLTVSVKGKTREELAKFGEEFEYKLKSEGFITLGDTAVVAEEDKPAEDEISDSDFINDLIETGEEVDFTFDI